METVAFYSYKGGVGRTLLVANTAQFLAMCGKRVVALDLDLEAPGLHSQLANPNSVTDSIAGEWHGAVDFLLSTLEGRTQIPALNEIAIELALPAGTDGLLHLIPAGAAPSNEYWATLERLNACLRATRHNGGLPEAVLELQSRIADAFNPDFLLIDTRSGITEIGGLVTSLLADRVVCLTTLAHESIQGIKRVAESLKTAPRLKSQGPLQLHFLLTRVLPDSSIPPLLSRLSEQLGESVAMLPHDAAVARNERALPNGQTSLCQSQEQRAHQDALYPATCKWIADTFHLHKSGAE